MTLSAQETYHANLSCLSLACWSIVSALSFIHAWVWVSFPGSPQLFCHTLKLRRSLRKRLLDLAIYWFSCMHLVQYSRIRITAIADWSNQWTIYWWESGTFVPEEEHNPPKTYQMKFRMLGQIALSMCTKFYVKLTCS